MKMAHHAGPSGYHRLAEFLPGKILETPTQLSKAERLCTRMSRPLWQRSGLQWYFRENVVAEWRLLSAPSPKRVHFLYGENSFRYLPKSPFLRGAKSILATIHTPEERFFQVVKKHSYLRRLDAAIVMSSVQIEFLQKLLGHREVHFIPHGIDTNYFTPQRPKSDSDGVFRFICVGSHLRDHQTLIQAAKRLASHPEIRFTVVSQAKLKSQFEGEGNIDFYSGISDEKLLSLYQEADALCLPLLDCTANNAILEGMACGLPIITTDMQGSRDYTTENNRILLPKGDVEALAEVLLGFTQEPQQRETLRKGSVDLAERFSWTNVAQEIQELYQRFN